MQAHPAYQAQSCRARPPKDYMSLLPKRPTLISPRIFLTCPHRRSPHRSMSTLVCSAKELPLTSTVFRTIGSPLSPLPGRQSLWVPLRLRGNSRSRTHNSPSDVATTVSRTTMTRDMNYAPVQSGLIIHIASAQYSQSGQVVRISKLPDRTPIPLRRDGI